jgi:hypothetical protein
MSRTQRELIQLARRTYNNIYPCAFRRNLEECFTIVGDKYVFWFNTEDQSTRFVACEVSEDESIPTV